MEIEEAAHLLAEMYESSSEHERRIQAHLFGIKYAGRISRMNLTNLIEISGLPRHIRPSLQTGIELAQHVQIKPFNQLWLKDALDHADLEKWCMDFYCTTCGSFQMVELLTGSRVSRGVSLRRAIDEMTWARAKEVIDGLRECSPETSERAMMWMLYMLWRRWGDSAHEDLFPVLDGTFAGKVLLGMREQYAAGQERRRLQNESMETKRAMAQERRRLHNLRFGLKKNDWPE